MLDWNDLRFFLAVLRRGSTLAASHDLKVNQTTVARRVEALEEALCGRLFERRPNGYRPTELALRLYPLAERVEQDAAAVSDAAAAWKRAVAGVVRVTTTELLAMDVLAPLVSALRADHPALQVELIADDRRLDVVHGQVDIAIRVGSVPEEPSVVRRRLGESVWSLYCSASYAERNGVPHTVEQLAGHHIIGGGGDLAGLAPLVALRALAPRADIAIRCNSVPNLIAAVRSGIGVGPLPNWSAHGDETLVACPIPEAGSRSDIWLLYHESQRDIPHMKVFREAVAERFSRLRDRLQGDGSSR